MKKITSILPVLAATLLLSAVTAFAGVSGPYGSVGPDRLSGMAMGSEVESAATFNGSGPYGSLGPMDSHEGMGMVDSGRVAHGTRGSGPYGAFGPVAASGTDTGKDECMLVASNCVTVK